LSAALGTLLNYEEKRMRIINATAPFIPVTIADEGLRVWENA